MKPNAEALKPARRRRLRVSAVLAGALLLIGAAQALASESVGDLVWNDANNNGMRDAVEVPIPGVAMSIYNDLDRNCVADGPALQSEATNAFGGYLFEAVGMGWYIVRIEPSNFATGGPLQGYVSSTGSIPESNSAADNNKDHGVPAGGGIQACGIAIFPPEPVGEGLEPGLSYPPEDLRDSNHQTTIDFGVFKPGAPPPVGPPPGGTPPPPSTAPPPPSSAVPPPPSIVSGAPTTRLALVKRANRTRLRIGQIATFTIVVRNAGSVAATNVQVCDVLRKGMILVRANGAKRTRGRVCWTIASLGARKTARYSLRFRMRQPGRLTNTAVAAAGNALTVRDDLTVLISTVTGVRRIPIVTG